MAKHNLLGAHGEALAAEWLMANGWVLLHRNWRYARYEIDIIASKDGILHFLEVKTRSTDTFGQPEESVSRKKIGHLLQAGEAFQFEFPQWKRVQFDVLSIRLLPADDAEYFLLEDVYL